MTEAEWLASDDPDLMLAAVDGPENAKRLALLALGCCRQDHCLLRSKRDLQAVEFGERILAGSSRWHGPEKPSQDEYFRITREVNHAMCAAARMTLGDERAAAGLARDSIKALGSRDERSRRTRLAGLVRCVFGNPFRSLPVGPWRTSAGASLALAAYEERALPSGHLDNARLGVLADSLEEAGCTDEALLTHLRSPGPHVRGCWALDLVLGKM